MWELSSSSVTATCLQCCKSDRGEGKAESPTAHYYRKHIVKTSTRKNFIGRHAVADSSTSLLRSPEGASGKHFLLQLSVKYKLPFPYLLSIKDVSNSSSSNAASYFVRRFRESEQNLSIGQTSYSTLRPNSHRICGSPPVLAHFLTILEMNAEDIMPMNNCLKICLQSIHRSVKKPQVVVLAFGGSSSFFWIGRPISRQLDALLTGQIITIVLQLTCHWASLACCLPELLLASRVNVTLKESRIFLCFASSRK